MQSRKYKKQILFDFGAVIEYFVLSVLFSLAIFAVNKVVLNALVANSLKKMGNEVITLYEVHNTGAAFNLFSDSPQLLINTSFVVIAIIIFIIFTKSAKLKHNAISSMALLSSGIFMNTLERIQNGYVTDYISCNLLPYLPVFNTADILIVCGALGIIISLFARN